MLGKRLLLIVDCHPSPVDNSYSYQGVLEENTLQYASGKRSLQNKKDRSLVKNVEIINLDGL